MENGISSAADFERRFKEQKAEVLTLPSGLKVRAYRPSPEWWLRHRGLLPASLITQTQAGPTPTPTTEELIEYSNWTVTAISEMLLEPRLSLNPSPGEVHPRWISNDDLNFLFQYAIGEVSADGRDLKSFRGGSDAAPAGAGGESVELQTQRVN